MADEKEKKAQSIWERLSEPLQSLGISALLIERLADFFKKATDAHKSVRAAYDGFREIRGQFTGKTDDEIILHYAKDLVIEDLGDEGRRMVGIVNHWLESCLTSAQRGQFTQLIGGSFVDQLALFSEYQHQKPEEQSQQQPPQQPSASQQGVASPQTTDPEYSEKLMRGLMKRAVEIIKEYAGYTSDPKRTQALIAAHVISANKIQRQKTLLNKAQQFVTDSEDALVRARQRYEESKRRRRR